MVRKAIFGGTFDPIHKGHINVAYDALNIFNLDKVIFVPAGNPPHKLGIDKTDSNIRYKMVNMAISKEKDFEVSDYEIKNNDISYTYKTLRYFNELEPLTEWYFITGEDCFSYLEKWKNIEEVFNRCKFVVFRRQEFKNKSEIIHKRENILKKYTDKILFIDKPILNISSTKIRKCVRENKEIYDYVPMEVYDFIAQNNLYKK